MIELIKEDRDLDRMILAAAVKAQREGRISRRDLRQIRLARFLNPTAWNKVRGEVRLQTEAYAMGSSLAFAEIDFGQILQLIIDNLPLILSLLMLFIEDEE